jgi:hypothetical protein
MTDDEAGRRARVNDSLIEAFSRLDPEKMHLETWQDVMHSVSVREYLRGVDAAWRAVNAIPASQYRWANIRKGVALAVIDELKGQR